MLTTTLGYSPWGNGSNIEPFDEVFGNKRNLKEGMHDLDAIVLWGGTDIPASFYGKKSNPNTQCSTPSERDLFEWKAIQYARKHRIPIIGVCRGAQMGCAAAGGTLAQHVSGHNSGGHQMVTDTGEIIYTNSLHHQMMNPFKVNHKMIAWCHKPLSNFYDGETMSDQQTDLKENVEPEIVYFPDIKCLAIQGHPEGYGAQKRFRDFCNEMIIKYLLS